MIAALAAAQGGRVSRAQLLRQGVGSQAIDHRVRRGRLHAVHRGVYAVGHTVTTAEGRWWAALLAHGDDALLSHASAAEAWELMNPAGGPVEVTLPRSGSLARSGVRLHHSRALEPEERTELRGMPITSTARTVLDLAARLPDRRVEQLLDRAESRRLLDVADLRRAVARHRGRAGTPRLARVLGAFAPTFTRSELEERFLMLSDAHGLPRPVMNAVIAGFEVDAHWPGTDLVVELDGFAHHRSRRAFEADRARDVALALAGRRVLRFTYRQIVDEPSRVADAIRRLLGVRSELAA